MRKRLIFKILSVFVCLMIPCMLAAKRVRQNTALISEEEEKTTEQIMRLAECGFAREIRVATTVNNRPFGWSEWLDSRMGIVFP